MDKDVVHAGLPLIDTLKTSIGNFCPTQMKKQKCPDGRFRNFDGRCNNLENANWGAVQAPFRRLIPPAYEDGTVFCSSPRCLVFHHIIKQFLNTTGISFPLISVTGQQLPPARLVSAFIHRDLGFHDHAVTLYLPAFGQLIDHDMVFSGETKGV